MKKNKDEEKDILVNRPIEEIIKELKMACNCERYPMFVSVAKRDGDKISYYNECLLASLEEPKFITRINKQLLALNGIDMDIPPNIKKCASDLASFVEQYKATKKKMSSTDEDLSNSLLEEKFLLAEGILQASVPAELFVNESADFDIDDLELDDF